MGQGSGIAVGYGICFRCSLNPTLLWGRWAIQPLAWKPPYAVGSVLKEKRKKMMTILTGVR